MLGIGITIALHAAAKIRDNNADDIASFYEAYSDYIATAQPKPHLWTIDFVAASAIPTSQTSLRANRTITPEALGQYLAAKESPLELHAAQILESPYWSLIVAITAAEQSFNRQPQSSPYNLWGMMKFGGSAAGLRWFSSFPEALDYMDGYFRALEDRGRTTVQSLRGYYCASACTTWEPTVLRVMKELEAL